MVRVALITGITGQDGSYLSELLLEKGYQVYGIIRRHSSIHTWRIDSIYHRLRLFYGDVTDQTSIATSLQQIVDEQGADTIQVLEIYNLAAQSHVKVSFELPEYTGQVDAMGTLRVLEAIRNSPIQHKIRFYQASTSELYGKVLETPQTETTPFNPQSPYAVAKMYSYWIVRNYRDSYGLFASNGILFNHTSPRRGETFVCKKITEAVARIHLGKQEHIVLGNMNAQRDLGHAKDYVHGMWQILQQDQPVDYVLSTGHTYSIRQLVEMAFRVVNVTIRWQGEGVDEVGVDASTGIVRVRIHPKYFRPSEVDLLLGDSTKARTELNWKTTFEIHDILKEMVLYDIEKHRHSHKN